MDQPPLLAMVDEIKASWDNAEHDRMSDIATEQRTAELTTAKINRLAVQSAIECAS